jgi:hypothetical protein
MDRRSSAPSCGDLRQADEAKAHHAPSTFNGAASPPSVCQRGADFRSQKLPTNLAQLSVKGARPLAIAQLPPSARGVIAQESVGASLAGSGIGDADTGIVGVRLCRWNAEGCQCYGCCRRQADYCPLHQFFLH